MTPTPHVWDKITINDVGDDDTLERNESLRDRQKREASTSHHQIREAVTPHDQMREAVTLSTTDEQQWTPFISYEAVMWTIHLVLCVVVCLDRFYWNVWPRETYTIGKGSAGNDRIELREGPWSVKFFDVIARVSGRYSMVTLNLLFLVRLKTVENWLSMSWINKYVFDCGNIVKANRRLHIWNGILFCVLLLLHVWSILLPCIVHRYGAQIVPGYFEYPLSERAPPGFKDADSEAKMMSLQVDDVFRMVEMSLVLGIMIPLSNYWFKKRYHIAIHMHRVAAVIVFVDIVRRHSHPHSIIVNSPVFIAWLLEKVYIAWTQVDIAHFHRLRLGDDYMVIGWNSTELLSKSVGPNFYLRLKDSFVAEPFHAFTSFHNRSHFNIINSHEPWTTGIVMRVYHNKRPMYLSKIDRTSHTSRMYHCKLESTTLELSGPFTGEMSHLIRRAHTDNGTSYCIGNISLSISPETNVAPNSSGNEPWAQPRSSNAATPGAVVLVGTGSGINYLIDALQHRFTGGRQMVVLWSTRDAHLFNWVSGVIRQIIPPEATNLRVILANTDQMNGMAGQPFGCEGSNISTNIIHCVTGRIDFEKEIPINSRVFFQGSSKVGKAVKVACERTGSWVFKGTGGKEVDSAARRLSGIFVNHAATEQERDGNVHHL